MSTLLITFCASANSRLSTNTLRAKEMSSGITPAILIAAAESEAEGVEQRHQKQFAKPPRRKEMNIHPQ